MQQIKDAVFKRFQALNQVKETPERNKKRRVTKILKSESDFSSSTEKSS